MSISRGINPTMAFILLACMWITTACKENEEQPLLNKLDQMLANKQVNEKEKELRISKLNNLLGVENLTQEQEYQINLKLYNEFRKYKLDSAICRIERNLVIAKQLNNREAIYFSNLNLAQLYSFSGMSVEAMRILASIRASDLPRNLLPLYYESYSKYYQHYAAISNQNKYLNDMHIYRDSLLAVADHMSFRYRINMQYKLLSEEKINEAEELLINLMRDEPENTSQYAEITYALGRLSNQKHNYEQEKKYYILSAIADLTNATKENASFHTLATLFYDRGDLSRAFKYTQAAIEDAQFSNVQFRTAQMSKIYSIINASYQGKEAKSKAQLQHYLILISVLSVFFVMLFVYAYKQVHKLSRIREALSQANAQLTQLNGELNEKNSQLLDANLIKKQYIARFFDLCSMYVDKMEDYRRSLNRIAQNRQFEELYKRLKSTSMLESELEELYKNFDAIFLNLYPTFVTDFNALLSPDEQIVLKSGDFLNKELRIYAMLRLGITDSTKIASFLRCSLSTVYNYRTKARNKAAISREDFEKKVMKIGVVYKNEE